MCNTIFLMVCRSASNKMSALVLDVEESKQHFFQSLTNAQVKVIVKIIVDQRLSLGFRVNFQLVVRFGVNSTWLAQRTVHCGQRNGPATSAPQHILRAAAKRQHFVAQSNACVVAFNRRCLPNDAHLRRLWQPVWLCCCCPVRAVVVSRPLRWMACSHQTEGRQTREGHPKKKTALTGHRHAARHRTRAVFVAQRKFCTAQHLSEGARAYANTHQR